MATQRQKKLAKGIVENVSRQKPLNKQELVESAGYAPLTADRTAKEVIESKGVQEELVNLGFTEDKAKKVVAEILEFGENDTVKLKAAEMIFKVHGTFAPEKKKIEGSLDITENSKLDSLIAEIESNLDEQNLPTI